MEGGKLKKAIIVMSTPAKIYFLTYAFPPCHLNKYLSPAYHLGHWISSDFIHSFLNSVLQQSFIDCLLCTRHCVGCYKYSKWKKRQKSKADSTVEWSEGDGIVRGEERKHTGKELVGHKTPCSTLAFNLSNGGPGNEQGYKVISLIFYEVHSCCCVETTWKRDQRRSSKAIVGGKCMVLKGDDDSIPGLLLSLP